MERKVGECYHWKAIGQCSKGDSCSFIHDLSVWKQTRSETKRSVPLCAKFEGTRLTERNHPKGQASGRKSFWKRRSNCVPKFPWVKESVRTRHVIICTLPCVSITSLNQDAHADSDTFDGQPRKKSKKSGGKGPVALLKESIQLGCVSQGSHPRKSVLRKGRKLGSNHTIKFSKGMWHHIKIRERKGPSRGVIQKCEPHERNPCAPRFEERTQEETLHQERGARKVAWNLAKNVYKLKNTDTATFYSPIEARATLAPTSKSPEERELVVDSGASMHMLSKKDLSSEELETLRRSRTPQRW